MHIELDTMEIMLIIVSWVVSKWVGRFVVLGLITKVVVSYKAKAVEKIENIKSNFEGNKEQ